MSRMSHEALLLTYFILHGPNQHYVNPDQFVFLIKLCLLIAPCPFHSFKEGIFGKEQTGSTAASSCSSSSQHKWQMKDGSLQESLDSYIM